jgi:hypothetical protein
MTASTWVNWSIRTTGTVGGLGWRESLAHRRRADGRTVCGRVIPPRAEDLSGPLEADEKCAICARSGART